MKAILLPVLLAASLAVLTAQVAKVQAVYDREDAARFVPLLSQVLRFPTVAGDEEARKAQAAWLVKTAGELGLAARDAGKVTEVDLPGPEGAPVLGLVVHGDVQPVDAEAWTFPPFSGRIEGGVAYGRGAADDKGPLVQALLAMHSLKESGLPRTQTVRLLVGSDEESGSTDIAEYLKGHKAPELSLVLDSEFPVVVGEKAWNSLSVTTPLDTPARPHGAAKPYAAVALAAGLATSIVPDHAELTLRWNAGTPAWEPVDAALKAFRLPEGTRLATKADGDTLRVVVYGKSAHAGVNLTGGRNALVALARLMEGRLPAGGADDLLAFARLAGQDFYGSGLGIHDDDPLWGRYAVNVATIKMAPDDPKQRTLTINLRRTPPRTGPQLEMLLNATVADFDRRTGAQLVATGFYGDEPLSFDPGSKIVKRLLDDYAQATGRRENPSISGGGTYAKRLPNSIAFGMWFHDKPYPGHDVDEKETVADLQKGARVLLYTLTDLATSEPIGEPFKP